MSSAFVVVILTKNEARQIEACIESVAGLPVVVLDSGSTDATVTLAKARGATVVEHPFKSFGEQRNWALDHVAPQCAWQFHLDADERMTPALRQEVATRLAAGEAAGTELGGYLVPSKLVWRGQWLKRSGQYPAYQMRLVHRARGRFVDVGHGQREAAGVVLGRLSEPYVHFGLEQDLATWLVKHVSYARSEAAAAKADAGKVDSILMALTSGDRVEARRALKRLSYRLPFRAVLRFLYMFVGRAAFLDGHAGILFSLRLALYDGMIAAFLREES